MSKLESAEKQRVFTLEEEVAGLTVISDAVKKRLDQKRSELSARMLEEGNSHTGTGLGEIRRNGDKVTIKDQAGWEQYAAETFNLKPIKEYRIIDNAAAIQVLLEHAPGLVASSAVLAPADLTKMESKLRIEGEKVVGPEGEPIDFAEIKRGSVVVASSARKKAAVEAAVSMIDKSIAPLGIQAIEA